MKRVPFKTDVVKEKYLTEIAKQEICLSCDCKESCKLSLNINKKRISVEDVQDLYEYSFTCPHDSKKGLRISKFFLPNTNFENDYIEQIKKQAEDSLLIDGKPILDELLKWGRIQKKKI